jgi:hypothetical protein
VFQGVQLIVHVRGGAGDGRRVSKPLSGQNRQVVIPQRSFRDNADLLKGF